MTGCVAVFDLGKTNIKVVVFDPLGAVLAERSAPNAPLAPNSTWPYLRLDTEGAWAFLTGALKELGRRFPIEAIVDHDARLRRRPDGAGRRGASPARL